VKVYATIQQGFHTTYTILIINFVDFHMNKDILY
jgi:hypothetical protein